MRRRLLKSEAELSNLLPGGEEEFHRLFGRVAAIKSQLGAWAVVSVALLVEFNIVPILLPPHQASSTPPTGLVTHHASRFGRSSQIQSSFRSGGGREAM